MVYVSAPCFLFEHLEKCHINKVWFNFNLRPGLYLSSSTSPWVTFSSYTKQILRCVLILPIWPPWWGAKTLAAGRRSVIQGSWSAAGEPAARSVLLFLVYAHLAWVPGVDTSRCDVTPALRLNAELRGKTLRWRQEGRVERKRDNIKKKKTLRSTGYL